MGDYLQEAIAMTRRQNEKEAGRTFKPGRGFSVITVSNSDSIAGRACPRSRCIVVIVLVDMLTACSCNA